jgi:alkylhydroperoxidase/carboxymuconolactone decarboxylase family protein YurZ
MILSTNQRLPGKSLKKLRETTQKLVQNSEVLSKIQKAWNGKSFQNQEKRLVAIFYP